MLTMKNGDMLMLLLLGLFLVGIFAIMKRYPAGSIIHNTESPLPTARYTSGNAPQYGGMETRFRKNYQEQSYGPPSMG